MSDQVKFEERPGFATNELKMDILHVADCCRACLRTECSLIETTSLDHDSIKFSDKLTACVAEVMWLKEGLQSLICSNCIENLRVAYDFRNVCLQSDQTFSRYISQMQDENKSVTPQVGNASLLEAEAKFDYTSTQVIPDMLTCFKEEPPNSPQMDFLDNDDWLEKSTDFNETDKSRNCAPEPVNWVDLEKQDLKPDIDAIDRQHNVQRPESSEVSQDDTNVIMTSSDFECKDMFENTPPSVKEAATLDLIPDKSRKKYEQQYIHFMEWTNRNKTNISENTLLAYFAEKRKVLKASTLWSHYSMLKATLAIKKNIQINRYSKLLAFLNQKPVGFRPTTSKTLSKSEMDLFLLEAPNDKFLMMKTTQLDQQQKLTHHQNESHLQQEFQVQQQKQVIKRKTGGQKRLRSLENITLDGGQSKGYTCTVCGETFRKNATLTVHMRIHADEKPVQCTVSCKLCDAKFTCSSLLSVHMMKHKDKQPKQVGLHSPEDVTVNGAQSKSYTCTVCGKTYRCSSNLTIHMRTHTGEKPFRCSVCNHRCPSAFGLKVHMRTHTGERPYSCDTCGKKYTAWGGLQSHIRTHTGDRPFSCKICDKTFTQSGHLSIHMRTHTGEKPYNCDTCGKKFTASASLKYHMNSHTGVRPFTCNICEKSFLRSSHLNDHMRKHTEEGVSYKT